jgi:AcrR family transcriptional regulator
VTELDAVGRTLLDAASDVLAKEGPSALTVRRIAAEAGVSTMNVYSRFGSKDGIVERLWSEGFARLRDATLRVKVTDDPLDDLRRCGEAYRRFALRNRTYYSVMFDRVVPNFEPSPQARVDALATLQLLADRIERVMETGAMPRSDPLHTAAALWAACHGVVSLELKDAGPHDVNWETVYRTATNALVTGLVAGAAAEVARGRAPR